MRSPRASKNKPENDPLLVGAGFWRGEEAAILARLAATAEGLTAAEAAARLERLGPNLLHPERRRAVVLQLLARFKNPHDEVAITGWEKLDEIPFDFERRRVSVLLRQAGGSPRLVVRLVVKGALEDVLAAASLAVVAAALVLPFTAAGRWLGFVAPPAAFFLVLTGMVALYLATVEVAKRWFYRHFAGG